MVVGQSQVGVLPVKNVLRFHTASKLQNPIAVVDPNTTFSSSNLVRR